jgi:hypothetical protein
MRRTHDFYDSRIKRLFANPKAFVAQRLGDVSGFKPHFAACESFLATVALQKTSNFPDIAATRRAKLHARHFAHLALLQKSRHYANA